MASQEIRFKIGGDATALNAAFAKAGAAAQQAGQKMDAAFNVGRQRALNSVLEQRDRLELKGASTTGKIAILARQLADHARTRKTLEEGSVKELQLREVMERKIFQIGQLQLKAQKERVALMPGLNAKQSGGTETPSTGAIGGLGEGLVKRIIWLGAGSVISGIVNAIRNQFTSKAEIAQAQEQSSGVSLASTRSRFAATGGLQGQLKQGRATVKDLEGMVESQKKLVADLKAGFSGFITPVSPESMHILTQAEVEVQRLIGETQKQHDANALIERDLQRQLKIRETILGRESKISQLPPGWQTSGKLGAIEVGREIGAIPETERAQRAGMMNPVEMARIALRQATGERKALYERDASGALLGTPEQRAEARIREREQAIALATARNNMMLAGANRAGISEDAAGGRTFRNGRAKPLSESERLARRAAMFRGMARDLVLEGSTGGGAGVAIDAARRDEASVAARLGRASEGVNAPSGAQDLTALKAEIVNSNKILRAIKDSLAPTSTN